METNQLPGKRNFIVLSMMYIFTGIFTFAAIYEFEDLFIWWVASLFALVLARRFEKAFTRDYDKEMILNLVAIIIITLFSFFFLFLYLDIHPVVFILVIFLGSSAIMTRTYQNVYNVERNEWIGVFILHGILSLASSIFAVFLMLIFGI